MTTKAFGFFESLPPPETVNVYLLTVDIGSGLERRFGHTILRVSRPETGEEYLLNWGTFDFEAPNFVLNFLRGKLRYWVSESGYQENLYYYEAFEKRTVWQDELNLSTQQKQRLLEMLSDRLNATNKYFWYDFFYNNCSTLPRDILNEVFRGSLEHIFRQQLAKLTLRGYVRRDLNEWPIIPFFLDIMLNSEVDHLISVWVELFHPLEVRDYFLKLPRFLDDGTAISGTTLLTDPQVLVHGLKHPRSPHSLFPWVFAVSAIWLLVSHLLILLGRPAYNLRIAMRLKTVGRKSFELFSFLWSVLSGVLGTILLGGWLLSNHTMLYHNANLWLFWPIDFLFSFASAKRLLGTNAFLRQWERALCKAHLVGSLAFLFLWVFKGFEQDVENISLFLLPIHVLYWTAYLSLRKAPRSTEST